MVPQPQYGNGSVGADAQHLDGVDLLLRNHAPMDPLITEVERELELRSRLQRLRDLGRLRCRASPMIGPPIDPAMLGIPSPHQ